MKLFSLILAAVVTLNGGAAVAQPNPAPAAKSAGTSSQPPIGAPHSATTNEPDRRNDADAHRQSGTTTDIANPTTTGNAGTPGRSGVDSGTSNNSY